MAASDHVQDQQFFHQTRQRLADEFGLYTAPGRVHVAGYAFPTRMSYLNAAGAEGGPRVQFLNSYVDDESMHVPELMVTSLHSPRTGKYELDSKWMTDKGYSSSEEPNAAIGSWNDDEDDDDERYVAGDYNIVDGLRDPRSLEEHMDNFGTALVRLGSADLPTEVENSLRVVHMAKVSKGGQYILGKGPSNSTYRIRPDTWDIHEQLTRPPDALNM